MADFFPSRLLDWLAPKVSSLVPGWLGTMFLGRVAVCPLYFDHEARTILQRRPGYVAPLGWLAETGNGAAKPRRLLYCNAYFPKSAFFEREIEIPAGARRNLRNVVELDMVRRTPFQKSEVFWTNSPPMMKDGKTTIVQWIAKRPDIISAVANLARRGIIVRQVCVEGAGSTAPIAILETKTSRVASFFRAANLALSGASMVFVIFAWLNPAWQSSSATQALETELETLREQAFGLRTRVDELREVETSKSELLSILRDRAKLSDVLRDVTVALPDSAWTDNLAFSTSRVVLNGTVETSAADLVLALAGVIRLENPRLSGPVSKTSSGGERFEITANLRSR